MENEREVFRTKDGSATIYWPIFDEHFHSVHGAVTESKWVYIQSGLKYVASRFNEISVFEMGFGTGLNTLLTYQFATKYSIPIQYTSIDAYPLLYREVESLNYSSFLDIPETVLEQLVQAKQNQQVNMGNFQFQKIVGKLQEVELSDLYQLIYFDAFAPSAQPELWEKPIFEKLYAHLQNGGCLVTYCAKGVVKRRLKSVGFTVDALPGPPGKREITRAIK